MRRLGILASAIADRASDEWVLMFERKFHCGSCIVAAVCAQGEPLDEMLVAVLSADAERVSIHLASGEEMKLRRADVERRRDRDWKW